MREILKSHGKYFILLAILLYILFSMLFNDKSILDNLDLTITITMALGTLYSEWLWKYNPLDKNPKIYGEYKMIFISIYDNSKRTMNFVIKQNLFSNRIYMNTKESRSESISSSIITKKDNHNLVYTYQNIPNATERDHSEIHFGTCTFDIVDNTIVAGNYYTDRKTTGQIKNIKKIK